MPPPKVGGPRPVTTPPITAPPRPSQPKAVKPADGFDGKKVDPELDAIRAQAEKTYASLIAKGARVVVSRSDGNGGQPIVSIIPPALANNRDPSVKYDVQVHYHGQHGTPFKPANESKALKAIEAGFDKSPPTVIVLPTAPMKAVDGVLTPQWKGTVKDTGVTANDGAAGVIGSRGQLTVSAHSFGRKALTEAIAQGGLKADRVDVQDAFWPTQGADPKALREWMKKNPDAKVRISVGMATKGEIEAHVKNDPFPAEVFDTTRRPHWDAELRPW